MIRKGDFVKVKENLRAGCYYSGLYFSHFMELYCGKIYKVESLEEDNTFHLKGIKNCYYFNDEMVSLANNTLKAEIERRKEKGNERTKR